MEHFGENEVHLWKVPLAASHVEEDQELDDLLHVLVLVEDDLLDGIEDHVLILGDALRNAVDDGLEAIVEALDVLGTTAGAVPSDGRGHPNDAEPGTSALEADLVQDGGDDQRQELGAVLSDSRHDVLDAPEDELVVVDERLVVQYLDELLDGNHGELVVLGDIGLLDVVLLEVGLEVAVESQAEALV